MKFSLGMAVKRMVTTLSGSILDQAILFGVLKVLYNICLPLIYQQYQMPD
ncbi:hypothetical protein ACFLV7_14270 [Chloroflexota bacterium]